MGPKKQIHAIARERFVCACSSVMRSPTARLTFCVAVMPCIALVVGTRSDMTTRFACRAAGGKPPPYEAARGGGRHAAGGKPPPYKAARGGGQAPMPLT